MPIQSRREATFSCVILGAGVDVDDDDDDDEEEEEDEGEDSSA